MVLELSNGEMARILTGRSVVTDRDHSGQSSAGNRGRNRERSDKHRAVGAGHDPVDFVDELFLQGGIAIELTLLEGRFALMSSLFQGRYAAIGGSTVELVYGFDEHRDIIGGIG